MTATIHNTYRAERRTVTSSPTPAPAATQASGMSYVSVQRIQCALNVRGAHLTVDGKWGPNTADALEAFMGHNFDYGYTAPPDGSAVVMVTPALNRTLVCPAAAPVQTVAGSVSSSNVGWWVAGALAVSGVALLVWAVPRV